MPCRHQARWEGPDSEVVAHRAHRERAADAPDAVGESGDRLANEDGARRIERRRVEEARGDSLSAGEVAIRAFRDVLVELDRRGVRPGDEVSDRTRALRFGYGRVS